MAKSIPVGSISHKIKQERGDVTEAYIDTDLLIIEVEVRPVLYTPPLCNDLRSIDVQEAWNDVAAQLNVNSNLFVSSGVSLTKYILSIFLKNRIRMHSSLG